MRPAVTALALLAALLAALPAAAARLRAGEHPDFTRLVFAAPDALEWSTERDARSVKLLLNDRDFPLDTDLAFSRIPRTRLLAVSYADGQLALALGCDCSVDVFRTRTGHVVIDIDDAPEGQGPLVPARSAALPASFLPLRLPPLDLFSNLVLPDSPAPKRRAAIDLPAEDQVRFRPGGSSLPPDLTPRKGSDRDRSTSCVIEASAREILVADPSEALAAFGEGGRQILGDDDRVDPRSVRRVANMYLKIGWGAEAMRLLETTRTPLSGLSALAAALDGPGPGFAADLPDPACGPASTLIGLLVRPGEVDWDRVDERELRLLIDALAKERMRAVGSRLEEGFGVLGREDMLESVNLARRSPDRTEASDTKQADAAKAAGTGASAVEEVIAILSATSRTFAPAQEIDVVNAMALRKSVPAGALRKRLHKAIADALVNRGNFLEAVELVAEGEVAAEHLLKTALAGPYGNRNVELASRLAPLVDASSRPYLRRIYAAAGLDGLSGGSEGTSVAGGAAAIRLLENAGPDLPLPTQDVAEGGSGSDGTLASRLGRPSPTPGGTGDFDEADAALAAALQLRASLQQYRAERSGTQTR